MSIARAVLICVQGIAYHLASTPPNKTPSKARFDSDHPWWIRIAPTVMLLHSPFIWLCAVAEFIMFINDQQALPLPAGLAHLIRATICRTGVDAVSRPSTYLTPITVLGVLLTVCGSLLRIICFRTLGALFTFDLTILPQHHLVVSGPYAFVRHPAYTGSLSMIAGLALVNLTAGSWVTECEILGGGAAGAVVRLVGATLWLSWWLAVGQLRCRAEDAELRKTFGKQWDEYAARVKTWYLPGLI